MTQRTVASSRRPAPVWRRWLGRLASLAGGTGITLLGLLLITFLIGRVVPIDPVLAVVGDRAPAEVYDRARLALGVDRPLAEQFASYVGQVVQGDLGAAIVTGRPVLDDLITVFPATLELATLGMLIGVLLGVPAGVMAAVHQGKWPDAVVRVIGLVGYSMPVFWLGLVGLLVLYAKLDLVGGPGRIDILYDGMVPVVTGALLIDSLLAGDTDAFLSALRHIVLPASLLGYLSMAYISRMTRSFMLDQLRQEYVATALIKGLPRRTVIWRHAFGNIRVPLLTVIVLSYASLLEGSVLTETVFSWPGLGRYITTALMNADMNAVLGGTLLVGLIFIGLNLLTDMLYRLLDPRAR